METVADPEIVGGGRCGRSRAVEGHEGDGEWYPLPQGKGLGSAPSPDFFSSILDLKMASFCALWVPVGGCIPLILPLDLPLYGNIIGAPVQHLVYFGTELALYDQE